MTDGRNDFASGKAEQNQQIPGDDQSFLKLFENLGDNCELGLLQRYGGVERPSLLRFNYTKIDMLIRGLKNRFADLALPGQVTVEWTDEWMIKENVYGFSYHTFNTDRDYDQARLIKEQERWLRYMAEKFLEELEIGDRIYVRKSSSLDTEPLIRALSASLRAYGPAKLLWVTVEDQEHPAGSVAWIDENIMRGWIAGFAPYSRAFDVETSNWMKLLRAAWGLMKFNDPAAFPPPHRATLVPTDFGGWTGSSVATNEFDWTVPRTPPDGLVMKHTLLQALNPPTEIFGCLLVNRVKPGQPYVALVDVWLPEGFAGDHVCLVFIGRPSVAIRRAVRTKTNVWQTIWVSTYVGPGDTRAFPRIELVGPAGTVIYTTNWRLYDGLLPPD